MSPHTDELLGDLQKIDRRLEQLEQDQVANSLEAYERISSGDPALAALLVDTFGNTDTAAAWLVSNVSSLGGQRPLTMLGTGRREEVVNTLGCIEHGICS